MWDDFEGLYGFHGHKCPMSTLGARLALAAMKALGVTKADQFSIKAHYRARNCALDGIQYVSGCTMGNGNLTYEETGIPALTLSMRDDSREVNTVMSDAAEKRFGEHKAARYRSEAAAKSSGGDDAEKLKAEAEAAFNALVGWVQTAPDDEVVEVVVSG